jgi:hypothetical protein
VLMLLATFAASVTYVSGLSAPGGFWKHDEDGHRPGDAVLKGGPHDARLKAFFVHLIAIADLYAIQIVNMMSCANIHENNMYVCITIAIVDLYAIQIVSVMSYVHIYKNKNFMLQNKIITYFGRLMIIGSLKCLYNLTVRL